MDKNKKLSRLMALDLRRAIGDKIIIVIEVIICVVLLAIALSGITGANHLNYLYKDINGLYVRYLSMEGMSEGEQQNIVDQVFKDYDIGVIELEGSAGFFDRDSDMLVAGYNDVMLERVPIKLSKGNLFSENYITDEYTEIILDKSFSKKFKIGQIISSTDLKLDLIEAKNYKIIGFLQNNYGVLDNSFNAKSKEIGIVKINSKPTSLNYKMVFTNESATSFLQKYDLLKYQNTQSIGENIYTSQDYLQTLTMDDKQIMSFFTMFLVIALGVYFSTIISSIVIKYNDNLVFNKNLLKIGTTKKEFLLVKLVNILLVSVLCILVSLVLLLAIVEPNISAIANFATMGAGHILGSMAIVIFSYAISEILEVLFMFKNIVKEKK